jgi:DNA phosphorothioation-associated putative methyltransferase
MLITDPAAVERAQMARRRDLLVYLALAAFTGRPRLSDLDGPTRQDIRALFPSHKEACGRADRLLFAAGQLDLVDLAMRASEVGKETPAAHYVHIDAIYRLPALLRIYEGCAQVFIGSVEDANIVKLCRTEAAVSYLTYPNFDREPHPTLAESLRVDLQRLRADRHDYRGHRNPPILHRKEAFVADDYPRKATFERLTRQEELAGLYSNPAAIGTHDGWKSALEAAGVTLQGHRIIRAKTR